MKARSMLLIVPVVIFLNPGCSLKKTPKDAIYVSTCYMYDNIPSVILHLYNSSTFSYQLPFVDSLVTGNWQRSNDTLILTSTAFTPHRGQTVAVKLTEFLNEDRLLIKSGKLFLLRSDGTIYQNCYLKKK